MLLAVGRKVSSSIAVKDGATYYDEEFQPARPDASIHAWLEKKRRAREAAISGKSR